MVRRSILIFFELLGILVLGIVLGAAALYWRLGSGPISVAYLTPYLQQALQDEIGFKVEIDDTTLAWNERDRTVDVKLIGATLLNAEDQVVIESPELGVSLSGEALMRGQFAPRSLAILHPTIRIERDEEGNFSVGAESQAGAPGQGILALLDELATPRDSGLGYLKQIDVRSADLIIDDRRLDIEWAVPDVEMVLMRTPQGMSGRSQLYLQVGDQTASLGLDIAYRAQDHGFALQVVFADVNPKIVSSLSDSLRALAPVDVPLSGTVALDSVQGRVTSVAFDVTGAAGHIKSDAPIPVDVGIARALARGTYDASSGLVRLDQFNVDFGADGLLKVPEPVSHSFPVRSLNARATWSIADQRIDIPTFKLALDRPAVEGSIALALREEGGSVSTSFDISGLTFDDLAKYWPAEVLPYPRAWIVKHMPAGKVTKLAMRLDGNWKAGDEFAVETLAGEVAATDTMVDYLPPMPKVLKASARATFNNTVADIQILGGESQGLVVKGGKVVISDLQKADQWTDVDLMIEGPLAGALATIDSPPLRFASKFGMKPADAKGTSSTHLKLRFIAENKLTVDQIQVNVDSNFKQATLPLASLNVTLSDGELRLLLDGAGLDLSGPVAVNGIPSTIAWRHNFAKRSPFASRYELKAEADATDWRDKMGLDAALFERTKLDGPVGVDLTITVDDSGAGNAVAALDLTKASLGAPMIGWEKEKAAAAAAQVEASIGNSRVTGLPRIEVDGEGLSLRGAVRLDGAGKFAGADITKLTFEANEIAGSVNAAANGWDVGLHGRMLDLKEYLEDRKLDDPNPPRGPRLNVTLNLDRVRLHENRYVHAVTGTMINDGLVWTTVNLRAGFDSGTPLGVAVREERMGRSFSITAEDAGAAMHAFDITDNVVGGKLEIKGLYTDNTPRSCLAGTLTVTDFRMVNAPVMARLLNAASVIGLVDTLTGEGLKFDTLLARFTKKDGVTRFENAKASGISMGLTASGSTSSVADTVDIEGSLVPANVINSVLGKLPIVGGLFGGSGGIFAINYKIEGDRKEPNVSANPLTVLTPGFTRNLFNIFDKRDDDPPLDCPKQG